ncbi:MAG TPA: BON domain-containing protein [Longimicrobiales bacterium]|nr:BON domain-containing protein [Longimicrobiales bacterium]
MKNDRRTQAMLALFGISAGVAGGVWLWRRNEAGRREAVRRWGQPRGSAQDVAEALRSDGKLGRRQLEVDTIAEGVVELNGTVRDRSEAERAVGIAQRTTGVYTVVNRLVVDAEEAQRSEARRRWSEGAPELRERHHYGMGVGMGTRRQSPATDPDRPSDKQAMLDRELNVHRVEDDEEVPARDLNSHARVESTGVEPGDEGTIADAGLEPRPDVPEGEEEAEAERPEGGGL